MPTGGPNQQIIPLCVVLETWRVNIMIVMGIATRKIPSRSINIEKIYIRLKAV